MTRCSLGCFLFLLFIFVLVVIILFIDLDGHLLEVLEEHELLERTTLFVVLLVQGFFLVHGFLVYDLASLQITLNLELLVILNALNDIADDVPH